MDQYLNMGYLKQAGVGKLLRSGGLKAGSVQQAVDRILHDEAYRTRARSLMQIMDERKTANEFARQVEACF